MKLNQSPIKCPAMGPIKKYVTLKRGEGVNKVKDKHFCSFKFWLLCVRRNRSCLRARLGFQKTYSFFKISQFEPVSTLKQSFFKVNCHMRIRKMPKKCHVLLKYPLTPFIFGIVLIFTTFY